MVVASRKYPSSAGTEGRLTVALPLPVFRSFATPRTLLNDGWFRKTENNELGMVIH